MKKIISLVLVLVLALTAIGGTLAYFTDTDKADNVFAVGNVTIDLIEQERDGKGGLQDFTQEQHLYPIVGSAQGEKDELGQPVAENYIDKIATVKNTGTEDAYIRAYFAIPSALDDGPDTFNPSLNTLHFNFGNKDGKTTYGNEWDWKGGNANDRCFRTEIDGISYNVYYADYTSIVKAGETTAQFISGVYLDESFNYDAETESYMAFGKALTLDEGWNWNNVKCPVFAVGVQAAGFDSAEAAVTEALGANYNPWAK